MRTLGHHAAIAAHIDGINSRMAALAASVASGSRLTLVVSDATSSAPEDLAFTVHYTTTVTSANNA